MRLTFSDHWGFNLSVSHLDSVARRKRKSFSTRYRSNERRDEEVGVLLLLSTWFDGRFEPHFVCQWMFRNFQFSGCCRRAKKENANCCTLPWRIRFSSCYRLASAVLGPLTWSLKLECRDFYELSRTLVAMLIDWCPRMSHAFIALKFSDPGFLERSWKWFNDFGAEAWSYSSRYGGMVRSGALIPFSPRNLGNLFILNQENSICDFRLCCRSFLTLSLPSTAALGPNFER